MTHTVGHGICTDQFTDTLELISTMVDQQRLEGYGVDLGGSGLLTVSSPSKAAGYLTVMDAEGRMVIDGGLHGGTRTFQLSPGVYVVRLSDADRTRLVKVAIP